MNAIQSNWLTCKTDTDPYLLYCCRIIKHYVQKIVDIAGLDDDRNRATDLISADDSCRVGVRIRANSALHYNGEFTMRFARASGARCEWQKIVKDGYGDYMVYGFRDADKPGWLVEWVLIDLAVFRLHEAAGGRQFKSNGDGTSYYAYRFDNFPKELIIASKKDGIVTPIPNNKII